MPSAPVEQYGIAKSSSHTQDGPHPDALGQDLSHPAISGVDPVQGSSVTAGVQGQPDSPVQVTSQDIPSLRADPLAADQPVYDNSTQQPPTHHLHKPLSVSVSTEAPGEVPSSSDLTSSTTVTATTKHVPTEVLSADTATSAPFKHHEGFSPVSSGPSSSHTSVTEASPKSSSTEESLVRSLDTGTGPKTQEDTPRKMAELNTAIPDGVPATPDGQLKREAAISYLDSGDATREPPFQGPYRDTIRQHPTPAAGVTPPDSAEGVHERDEAPTVSMADQDDTAFAGDAPSYFNEAKEPSSKIAGSATEQATLPTVEPPQRSTSESETHHPARITPAGQSDAAVHKAETDMMDETPEKKPAVSPSEDVAEPMELDRVSAQPQEDEYTSVTLDTKGERQKPRSNTSTVFFPRKRSPDKEKQVDQVYRADSLNEEKDYLYSLFQAKAHCPPRSMNLNTLLSTAHKTLNSSNHFLDYEEQMNCRTLKRIYQLQNANKWPLRQLQRSSEPERSATHWDVLLDHMKWMSTDFKEERKWKIAAAKSCADWCAEYIASDEEGRSMLRVKPKRRPPPFRGVNPENLSTPNSACRLDEQADAQPTPDLVPSMDDDSSEGFNDDLHPNFDDAVTPAGIFALGSDEFTFRMERTPASDKILDELPLCEPAGLSPETGLPPFQLALDGEWKKDLLPVSKYSTFSLGLDDAGPPRKRSRYDHSATDMDEDEDASNTVPIPPDQRDVALFQAENKHIRDRIHPGHSFRPPTEYAMPSLGFYEARQSSQWTYAEDDELRKLVREYSYNWSLISSCLSPQSKFSSGADRRTPWECFERWIGLEGLPADMAKTPYFRAYSARLEAAQRTVLAAQQQQQQQQQSGNGAGSQALVRRRTTQPVRVDRKRTTRHLAMLAGMRKLSQKREALLQKQQHGMSLNLVCSSYLNLEHLLISGACL